MIFRFICLLFSSILLACVDHSPSDHRVFECHTLDNGLEVVLIEDSEAKEAAAAMRVKAGSRDDPQGLEGLAHFLEHMLFIGTEKYPDVDYLSEFVTKHGGSYNAYTASTHTQYYFSIKPEFFLKGLDIFNEFFISPLFSNEYIEREKHAVHAEFKMNQLNDSWRRFEVMKLTSNTESPENRFSIGNLSTLVNKPNLSLRQAVVDFYHTHYSADKMYFVAVTPGDISEIRETVISKLNGIQKRHQDPTDFPLRITDDNTSSILKVKTLKTANNLLLSFPLPNMREKHYFHATAYIAKLINDEGPGSLFHFFKKEGWVNGLTAGAEILNEQQDLFNISISLSNEGLDNIDEIIASTMHYISLIFYQGIDLWRFHEFQQISYVHFLYYQPRPALSQVNSLVGNMPYYNKKDLITSNYVTKKSVFSEDEIKDAISYLSLSNVRVTISSPQEKTDKKDLIFGTDYTYNKITSDQLKRWSEPSRFALSLSEKNRYLPEEISSVYEGDEKLPTQESLPELIFEDENKKHWYIKDDTYHEPRVYILNQFIVPDTTNLKEEIMASLMTESLRYIANDDLYAAEEAGLSWGVGWCHQNSICFSARGIGDKHILVVDHLLKTLKSLSEEITPEILSTLKENTLKSLINKKRSNPTNLLLWRLQDLLYTQGAAVDEKEQVLNSITIEDLRLYINTLWENVLGQQSLYYGNVTQEESLSLQRSIQIDINAKQYTPPKEPEIIPVPAQKNIKMKFYSNHHDNGALTYFQAPDNTVETRLMIQLLSRLIAPVFFEQLRTEEQLGYIVRAQSLYLYNWPALAFYIQSPTKNSKTLLNKIHAFVDSYSQILDLITEEEFEAVKSSLAIDYKHPLQSMQQVYRYYNKSILENDYHFDNKEQALLALDKISLDMLRDLFVEMTASNPRSLDLYTGKGRGKETALKRYRKNYSKNAVSSKTIRTDSVAE